MKDSEENFGFEKSTYQAWVSKINKDLKGAPLEQLRWSVDRNISILPFQHFESHSGDQRFDNLSHGWLIGEIFIQKNDLKAWNKEILSALQNGVNAPEIQIFREIMMPEFDEIFREIILDYIAPSFVFSKLDVLTKTLLEWDQYLTAININKNHSPLRIHYSGPQDDLIPIYEKLNATYPSWKFFTFYESTLQDDNSKSESTIKLLNQTNAFISRYKLLQNVSTISWRIKSGPNYYIEITRLRALRWCWGLILESLDVEQYKEPFIDISIDIQAKNPNNALISATIETLSALQGGVHKISITPEEGTEHFKEYQRLGRNIQNIMQLESKLDKVIDPAEGSYYLEKLTEKIAAVIWEGIEI